MFKDNIEDNNEDITDVDYKIDAIEYSQDTLNYGLYVKTNQFERHIENITNKYKNIAITWLLGTYAAIGFLLSVEVTQLPFNHLISIFILSFLSFLGNSLIWHLDVNVYSKFWVAVFIEEIAMEKKFLFLLPTKSLDLSIDEERHKIFSHAILYIVANMLQILTMGFVLMYLFKDNVFYSILIGFVFVVFLVITCFFMVNNSKKIVKVFNKILNQKISKIKK